MPTRLSPAAALERLQAGNARFVGGEVSLPENLAELRAELARGQHPHAALLGCADSRVPPQLVFGAAPGELFVARIAGNVVRPGMTDSLDYAVNVLGVPLIVVLGHFGCGAVTAALEQPNSDNVILQTLQPAARQARQAGLRGDAAVAAAVLDNVRRGVRALRRHPAFAPALAAGRLDIVGAAYHLESGQVEWLDPQNPTPQDPTLQEQGA